MRLDDFRPSDNVEDRRGESGGGGGFNLPVGGGKIGIVGIAIVLVLSYITGINPMTLFGVYEGVSGLGGGQMTQSSAPGKTGAPADQSGQFVARILDATEETWTEIFRQQGSGQTYKPTQLVLFSGGTRSACGSAQSAMGPFYCPKDQKVYLDTTFFDELRRRFHACPTGEGACAFSQAYVIAHEVGHHVQNQLGILPKVHDAEENARTEAQANALSVALELQADCLAGVWASHAQQRLQLQQGDVDAALQTASAIGDDTLQRATRGQVVPDSFTHGTAEQRKHWLGVGLQSGKVSECLKTFQR